MNKPFSPDTNVWLKVLCGELPGTVLRSERCDLSVYSIMNTEYRYTIQVLQGNDKMVFAQVPHTDIALREACRHAGVFSRVDEEERHCGPNDGDALHERNKHEVYGTQPCGTSPTVMACTNPLVDWNEHDVYRMQLCHTSPTVMAGTNPWVDSRNEHDVYGMRPCGTSPTDMAGTNPLVDRNEHDVYGMQPSGTSPTVMAGWGPWVDRNEHDVYGMEPRGTSPTVMSGWGPWVDRNEHDVYVMERRGTSPTVMAGWGPWVDRNEHDVYGMQPCGTSPTVMAGSNPSAESTIVNRDLTKDANGFGTIPVPNEGYDNPAQHAGSKKNRKKNKRRNRSRDRKQFGSSMSLASTNGVKACLYCNEPGCGHYKASCQKSQTGAANSDHISTYGLKTCLYCNMPGCKAKCQMSKQTKTAKTSTKGVKGCLYCNEPGCGHYQASCEMSKKMNSAYKENMCHS
jgi:hypothetical protein